MGRTKDELRGRIDLQLTPGRERWLRVKATREYRTISSVVFELIDEGIKQDPMNTEVL